jgi:signal transduction histidine kinase
MDLAVPRWVRDGAGGVVLLVLAVAPFGIPGTVLSELPVRGGTALHLLLAAVQTLPLAARRVAPATTLAVVGVGFVASQLVAAPATVAGVGVLVALYSAGRWQERGRTPAAAAALLAYAGLAVAAEARGAPATGPEWVTFGLVLVGVYGAGLVVRARTAQDAADQLAVERARIARELHDVVTHHVTAMVVQADAGPYVGAERAGETFEQIGATGRAALTELRHLLDAIDPAREQDGAREPAVGTVAETVARVRASGYPVELDHADGEPLPDGVALALVRVVQEGLTNAMKHAGEPGARVRVEHRAGEVEVVVRSGTGRAAYAEGRGIAGLRQRVELVGGRLSAGPDGKGEFVLRAVLPR